MSTDYGAKVEGLTRDELIERSVAELELKTGAHEQMWQLSECEWSADFESGTLTFRSPTGKCVSCSVQVVGTFDSTDGSFLWGWDHPSVPDELAVAANAAKSVAGEIGDERLTTRKLSASEEECWEFAAICAYLTDAQGAYRGPAGDTYVFMTFSEPTLSMDAAVDPDEVDGSYQLTEMNDVSTIPANVTSALTEFIAAMHGWEVEAMRVREETDFESAHRLISDAYELLLKTHCTDSGPRQGMAYGSDPSHDPERERIVGGIRQGDIWVLRTSQASEYGGETIHEYELINVDQRWLINQVFYVDDEGRWESL